jgi:hypothetical protein
MEPSSYKSLIEELSRLIGLHDKSETLYESGNLLFRDVAVTLCHREDDDDLVNVYVDFGAAPEHRALEIYRRLLEINLLASAQGSPRLGVDLQTRRVVFTYAQPLQKLSPEKLLGGIDAAVGQALAWRDGYFLDAPRARDSIPRGALQI